jgi:choice-of-anchor C domain-containing protein
VEACEPRLALAAGGVLPTLVDGSYGRPGTWSHDLPVAIGDVTYYTARTSAASGGGETTGLELWRTDGTAAGTWLVKDINPGEGDSSPDFLTVMNGLLYFTAYNSDSGAELWRSDGTAAGTQIVRDIFPGGEYTIGGPGFNGPYSSEPRWLTAVNGTLYFNADDGIHGAELWKSDGTFAGTVMVKDLAPGADPGFPQQLTSFGGKLFFTLSNGVNSRGELWRSDGTAAGTVMVKDINPGAASSLLHFGHIVSVNDRLYFNVSLGEGRSDELWTSDGTTAGTTSIDIPAAGAIHVGELAPAFGSLWFSSAPVADAASLHSRWRLAPPTASSDVNGDGRSDVILRDPDSGEVTAQIRNLDGSLRETRLLGMEAANRVANGGFESVAAPAGWFTTYGTGATIGGWRVTAGTVQVKGKGFWQAGAGVQSLDLNGDGTGAMAQDVSTTAGESYDLTFRLAGNPDGGPAVKTVDVTWGTAGGTDTVVVGRMTFTTTGRSRTDMGWIDVSLPGLKATGTKMVLGFVSQTAGAFGPALDGILLRQAGAADWTFVAATDTTGDGVADLIWRQGSTGTCVVWVMNAFNVRTSARILGGDKRLNLESSGDFDGDGRQDLIWRDAVNEQHWLWRMRNAQATAKTSLGIRAGLRIVPVDPSFDANGDGRSDILWRSLATGTTTLWRMNGATLVSATVIGSGANGVVVGAADYDGDGQGDVLWRRPTDGRVTQWLLDDGRLRTATAIGGTLDTTVVSGGDFNGDGKGDTVWRITSSGTAVTRLLDGKSIIATWAAATDPRKAVVRRPGLPVV